MNMYVLHTRHEKGYPTLGCTKKLVRKKPNAIGADNESNKIGGHHHDNIQDCAHSGNMSVPDLLSKLEET